MKKLSCTLSAIILIAISHCQAQSNYIGSGVSLKFDGVPGTYVNIGDSYNSLAFPFSFETWVRPTDYPPIWAGIFGSDNDASLYHGFWVRTSSSNTLQVEFGDGFGSGYQFRRGMITSATIPLNKWTHIAVVCNSVTDIHFYFNGVEQTCSPTDGASSVTAITHSSAAGSFGGQFNIFANHVFEGQMDEIRLWDITRTQTEIRDYMCRKIDPATSGLLGYWVADESYTGSTVNDQTSPSENGTIYGTVTKQTSGAPIGDESSYTYTSNWNGVMISEQDPTGDEVVAENISGAPYGVHVYEVKSFPYDTVGLDTVPFFYFGVFCAQQSSIPDYDVQYDYNFANGVINSSDENSAALFRRDDGSVTVWSNANATLDTSNNSLVKSNEDNRGEYILSVHYVNSQIPFAASDKIICEKFCIDFEDLSTNNPTQWYWIFPGGSPSTSLNKNPNNICYNTPGTYDVTLITDGAGGVDTVTIAGYITVFATPPFPTISQIGYTLTSSSATLYQWQFNTEDIPGATFQSYAVMQSGYYTVLVTDSNGCQNSTTVYVLIDGIDNIVTNRSFLIYPNPATENITLLFPGDTKCIARVRITDLTGKVLKAINKIENKESVAIDVSDLNSGFYVVEATTSSCRRFEKFEVRK